MDKTQGKKLPLLNVTNIHWLLFLAAMMNQQVSTRWAIWEHNLSRCLILWLRWAIKKPYTCNPYVPDSHLITVHHHGFRQNKYMQKWQDRPITNPTKDLHNQALPRNRTIFPEASSSYHRHVTWDFPKAFWLEYPSWWLPVLDESPLSNHARTMRLWPWAKILIWGDSFIERFVADSSDRRKQVVLLLSLLDLMVWECLVAWANIIP